MAKRTDKAVEIFSNLHLGKIDEKSIEVQEARKAIQTLAQNPTPANRYEIAQLMGFIVNDIINQKTQYLQMLADTKNVSIGEKAYFKIKKSGVQAYIQAKNGTTERSRIYNAYTSIETKEVSARPYVNLYELAAGKVNFDELINDAADEMEKKMVQNIEATLYASFAAYNYPFYASGSGFVAATVDPMIRAFRRWGNVTLLGDPVLLQKIADSTGFTTTTSTKQFADSIIIEQNQNGFIGTYKGSNVIQMNNPFERGTLPSTVSGSDVDGQVLMIELLYIIPAGTVSPLKVVIEGGVESMDAVSIDDNTMDVCLRQYFGSAVIYGDNPYLGVYEDTAL
jgi:hypothetical protein